MGLSAAERNRRKRERKKKEKADAAAVLRQANANATAAADSKDASNDDDDETIEIEYIAEVPVEADAMEAVRRFQARAAAAVVVSDEDGGATKDTTKQGTEDDNDNHDTEQNWSKRKIRDMIRPSIADLKRKVQRPDLVEAHDVTAPDPEFLMALKGVPGTVPVPRHWGRKRKYLQGKRGFEKPPFQLPDFLVATGITELRDSVMGAENEASAKQKNRARVTPKLGAIDVDYRTLHDAFFKQQTKPRNMTKFGDLYYEGKEMEVSKHRAGRPLSAKMMEALGMEDANSPPPWLVNMQRYGPPPSYPALRIQGLNAPLPSPECQFGYHPGGWGKPPVDQYGRPVYGGNPFDPPGSSTLGMDPTQDNLVTSDGKTVRTMEWGALPTGEDDDNAEDEAESSSDDEMSESEEEEEEEEEEEATTADGMASTMSTLPPPSFPGATAGAVDLRKGTNDGTDTPAAAPKQLYTVLDQTKAAGDSNAVFASEIAYQLPSANAAANPMDGAESVLSKALPPKDTKRRKQDDDDEDNLGKNFKF